MKLHALLVLVGACGFSPTEVGDVQPDARLDQPPIFADAAGSNSIARTCHVSDPSIRLCLDFEDPTLEPTVADASHDPHDGAATDVEPMTRTSQQAAAFSSTSNIHIDETPDLDIADNLTYELWIQLHAQGTTAWPLDNYDQYALGVSNDHVFCYANGTYADTYVPLGVQTWHHVACVYSGGKLLAYVDGVPLGCATVSGPIPNVNAHGINLGDQFPGGLDDVHIYATALDARTIATLAGLPMLVNPPNSAACGDV